MSLKQMIPAPARRRLRQSYDAGRYHLSQALGGDRLMPPPWLHAVGDSDFRKTGEEFLRHFVELGGLKPGDRVLDIGSGTGRMAAPLTTYLTTGCYDGMDIVRESVEWCRKAYAGHANFRFHHSDLYNKYYNDGTTKASEYVFPFADDSFDFIFLTSVFTHMLTEDVQHYLDEMARVLAPGGRALITAFLLDDETRGQTGSGKAAFRFEHRLDGCYVELPEVPERATAYDAGDFAAMVGKAGLSIRDVYRGTWRGLPGLSFQDIVIAVPHA